MEPSPSAAFLARSLASALSLSLHHASGLLAQPAYLCKILCKGLKGSFQPIQTWYREVYSRSRELGALMEREERGIATGMEAIGGGLGSEDAEVRYWVCRTITKVSGEIGEKGRGEMRQWVEREKLKDLICLCYSDSFLLDPILDLLLRIWPFPHFPQLFNSLIPSYLPQSCALFQFLACAASALLDNQSLTADLQSSGLIDNWLALSLKSAQYPSSSTRLSAYFLLSRLWIIYANMGISKVCEEILAVFGQGMSDRLEAVRVVCAGIAMEVIERMGAQGNAMEVWRMLVVKMAEEEIGSRMGDFYLVNAAYIIRKWPISPLLSLILPKVFPT
jgi:hypothetical protein